MISDGLRKIGPPHRYCANEEPDRFPLPPLDPIKKRRSLSIREVASYRLQLATNSLPTDVAGKETTPGCA